MSANPETQTKLPASEAAFTHDGDAVPLTLRNSTAALSELPEELLCMIGKFTRKPYSGPCTLPRPWRFNPLGLAAVNKKFRKIFLPLFWEETAFSPLKSICAVLPVNFYPRSQSEQEMLYERESPIPRVMNPSIQKLHVKVTDLPLFNNRWPELWAGLKNVKTLIIQVTRFQSAGWDNDPVGRGITNLPLPNDSDIEKKWGRRIKNFPSLQKVRVVADRHRSNRVLLGSTPPWFDVTVCYGLSPTTSYEHVRKDQIGGVLGRHDRNVEKVIQRLILERNNRIKDEEESLGNDLRELFSPDAMESEESVTQD